MKIYLASDHGGFLLKNEVKIYLQEQKYDIEDCGAYSFDPNDDYPIYIAKAAEAISKNPQNRGIILGGSGQAEAIVANKFKKVRAALFYGKCVPQQVVDIKGRSSKDPFEIIRLSREHNNTNILSLGARFLTKEETIRAIQLWLETPFSNDTRHVRRLAQIEKIENQL